MDSNIGIVCSQERHLDMNVGQTMRDRANSDGENIADEFNEHDN